MARSKNKKSKKSKLGKAPAGGKKGKKKYGLRVPIVPLKPRQKAKKAATPAAKAKKKAAPRKKAKTAKKKQKKKEGSSQADQVWDANYARAVALHAADRASWWYHMTGEDKSFGAWLQTQRYNRKVGRLRPDREARLKKIDFVWDTIEATWQLRFRHLKRRIERGGEKWWQDLVKADPQLEAWCRTQRRAYHAGELPEQRVAQLESIGFAWSGLDELWEQKFAELCEFFASNPQAYGRVGKDNAPQELVHWTMSQRRKHAAGELPPERVQQLEEIGFSWDGRQAKSDAIWERHFADLAAHNDLTGDANPGPDDDLATFRWLFGQRKIWDELPAERRARLEAIGVSRTTPPDQIVPRRPAAPYVPDWERFFRRAEGFKKRFGHLRIAQDEQSAQFPGLLAFAGKLRSGRIVPEAQQRAKLDELGFVWDLLAARVADFFDTRFAELVEYKRQHGDCNVSQLSETHRALGQWVLRLRLTRDELEPEQRERLDRLGFVWELKKQWMEGQWELRFGELLEYRRQNGDCLVPQDCPEWYTLSRWVSRMRQTKAKLGEERVRRLDEVGFVWDAKAAERAEVEEARCAELAAFVASHGHARVTRGNDPTGGKLNAWIVRQREKRKKGDFDPELERRLDALGFVWVTR